jgi:hypothetical protein
MSGKIHSDRNDDKPSQQKKKEPNLGQKEARQQQQSDTELEQMGDRSSKAGKDKRQQG